MKYLSMGMTNSYQIAIEEKEYDKNKHSDIRKEKL